MREQLEHTLKLSRVYRKPVERVYRAFVTPEAIRAWWAPRGWCTPSVEIDPRVGGRYRFGMHEVNDQGEPITELMYIHGEYREVRANELLEFTYVWEGGGEGERWRAFSLVDHETTVRIEFIDLDGATELRITHAGFPDPAGRDVHIGGWSSNNDELEHYLESHSSDGFI